MHIIWGAATFISQFLVWTPFIIDLEVMQNKSSNSRHKKSFFETFTLFKNLAIEAIPGHLMDTTKDTKHRAPPLVTTDIRGVFNIRSIHEKKTVYA